MQRGVIQAGPSQTCSNGASLGLSQECLSISRSSTSASAEQHWVTAVEMRNRLYARRLECQETRQDRGCVLQIACGNVGHVNMASSAQARELLYRACVLWQ